MAKHLERNPIHLGRGSTVVSEPDFTGVDWYPGYVERHAADGAEGRLVSMFSFSAPWTSWEMHPAGSEAVICTAGEMTVVQEIDGREVRTTLKVGEYAINPPGVWHTADITSAATGIFITAGFGTQVRPR